MLKKLSMSHHIRKHGYDSVVLLPRLYAVAKPAEQPKPQENIYNYDKEN